MYYKGWNLNYYSNAPVTSKWSASRYGVSMCAENEKLFIKKLFTLINFQKNNLTF